MEDVVCKLEVLIEIIDEISKKIEKTKNFEDTNDFVNYMTRIIQMLSCFDTKDFGSSNIELTKMLYDIVDAFENKDSVLMVDILENGIKKEIIEILNKIKMI